MVNLTDYWSAREVHLSKFSGPSSSLQDLVLIQSGVVLVWALANLNIEWNVVKEVTLLLMIVSGVLIFTGIYILAATLCFWTIEGLEVVNIFTDGGRKWRNIH